MRGLRTGAVVTTALLLGGTTFVLLATLGTPCGTGFSRDLSSRRASSADRKRNIDNSIIC